MGWSEVPVRTITKLRDQPDPWSEIRARPPNAIFNQIAVVASVWYKGGLVKRRIEIVAPPKILTCTGTCGRVPD